MLVRRNAFAALVVLLVPAGAGAESLGPVYKDTERFGPALPPYAGLGEPGRPTPYGHLPTRFDGGPGYVGSDWGLGRPAVTGLGTRPDWGRSGE